MQRSVLDDLERSAEKYPKKTAFADVGEEISYQELVQATKRIASGICRRIGGGFVNR